LIHFLDTLTGEYGLETIDELLSFQHTKIFAAAKLPKNIRNIKKELRNVPQGPGVYFMKNKDNDLIYVGKAKNLSNRLRSYFYHNTSHTGKVRKMLREIHHVEFETTGSELSALIMESRLIKKHKPRFNSATKRYSRFPFIKIDVGNSYPRAVKTYEIKLDGAKYYGPFRSSFTVNSLLENINKNFKLRKCDYKKLVPERGKSACMYYEIKQCKAPCNFSQTTADYRKEVKRVMNFLETEASEGAIQNLELQMYEFSNALKFEEASYIRDKILDLKRVIQNIELTSNVPNLRNFVVKCKENTLQSLYEIFFVANGKLLKNLSINENEVNGQKSELKELISNIYFRGNLFNSILYNNSGKFTKEELDSMKILTNWIHQNNSPSTILKVGTKTTAEEILSFIYS
jgi:excinuclease UvrABC nuclease subunit